MQALSHMTPKANAPNPMIGLLFRNTLFNSSFGEAFGQSRSARLETHLLIREHSIFDAQSSIALRGTSESCAARVVPLVAHSFHNLSVPNSNPARVTSRFFFWQGRFMHMPVNTAVRAVVR